MLTNGTQGKKNRVEKPVLPLLRWKPWTFATANINIEYIQKCTETQLTLASLDNQKLGKQVGIAQNRKNNH
jgi:hypothetical protein